MRWEVTWLLCENNLFGYVLHGLHELLLVVLRLLLLVRRVALSRHHRLAHRSTALLIELGVLGSVGIVEVLSASLGHGSALVISQLEGSLG